MAESDVLRQLRAAIDSAEAEFVRFLRTHRGSRQDAIDYRDIELQIARGGLNLETLDAWRADYARFVNERLAPLLDRVAGNPTDPRIQAYLQRQEIRLANSLASSEAHAVRLLVRRGIQLGQSPRQVAELLRPLIGLNAPQGLAVQRYAQTLRDNNVRESVVARRVAEMSHRLQRIRAETIARTELVTAYTEGAESRVYQRVLRGEISRFRRIWRTQEDERVCFDCDARDGEEVLDGDYPPLHPRCRCALDYLLW